MSVDIASLHIGLTISMMTMAVALPAVMGKVDAAARRAQLGVVCQGVGWAMLLSSGLVPAGSALDRLLSTLAMAGISAGLVLNATAFDLWRGRPVNAGVPVVLAVVMTVGYCIGFSSYPFRVGWANFLLALQMALMALSLARPSPVAVGPWRWLLVVSLALQVVFTAGRGVLGAFYTEAYPTFLAPHPVNLAFALGAHSTAVLSLVGILLAHRDEAARALERLATVDGLTGVLNRRAWRVQAEMELAQSLRYDRPLAVLMLDLDHFKRINDTRGHEAGDRALRCLADALRASVRTGDVVGRYGGEEFCVLMNQADPAAANAFDRRLRERLDETARRQLGHSLSYSAGIAMRLGEGDGLDAMLRRADATLYAAKAQGRARTLEAPSSDCLAFVPG